MIFNQFWSFFFFILLFVIIDPTLNCFIMIIWKVDQCLCAREIIENALWVTTMITMYQMSV